MAVTLKEVEHVAKLAHLIFSEDEKQRLTTQINAILEHMEQLNALDTSGVEPLAQVIESENVLRDDVVVPGLTRAEAMRNAPQRNERFFKVPKVIGDR